ncbi:response regulator [Nostoc sp. UIC 10630]|uniref:response regulator n=1 Tax=Nostoc sp. UIC 10630 TaxID=2100146 RepID=UPI0013D5FEF5|nr:response regulator [Nostoc sp. UIC 10630]NEU83620.1 response regulator [Nostoc sp. UIC 10630]
MDSVIKRILICDDVADSSFLLKTILQASDRLIEIVDSGAAVLAYLETAPNPPDLLILDVMMPKMDGFEVIRHLQESAKFQFIPILLVTAFDEDDADKALDIKINGFIKKPIDPDLVTAKVQAILAGNYENFPNNNNFIQR